MSGPLVLRAEHRRETQTLQAALAALRDTPTGGTERPESAGRPPRAARPPNVIRPAGENLRA